MKIPRVFLPLCMLTALCGKAAPVRAFVNGGLQETVGSEHYAATYGYADFGGDWHVKPSFNVHRSDASTGTFKTFSARIAYDQTLYGAGFTFGFSPKVNGYSNTFVGADGTLSLIPGKGFVHRLSGAGSEDSGHQGSGLARIDIGAGLLHTTHRDEFQLSGSVMAMGAGRRAAAAEIGQTDLSASAGVSFLDTALSAETTKSVYDKDLAAVNARPALSLLLPGLASVIQGFPDTSTNLRLDWDILPALSPYISYTYTRFKLDASPAKAYDLGVKIELGIVEVKASFEHYVQSGFPTSNYTSLGAGVRF